MCNKNLDRRDNETVEACTRCSYDADKEFWNRLVDNMNKDYMDLLDVVTARIPNVTTMTIDTVDLSDFYQKVNYAEKREVFHSLGTHGNMENTTNLHVCICRYFKHAQEKS